MLLKPLYLDANRLDTLVTNLSRALSVTHYQPLAFTRFYGDHLDLRYSRLFTGRSFGKHKLAPTISPNKTWEGVAGALIAVLIYGLAWDSWLNEESIASKLVPLLLFMAILGIIGDLYESLIKRHAEVKDSGNILPGHGGILDRIDALTSSLPLAILALLIFIHPLYENYPPNNDTRLHRQHWGEHTGCDSTSP